MRKLLIAILMMAGACTGFAETFQPATGDWNVAANWDTGNLPTSAVDAFVDGGRTATIPTGSSGIARRTFVRGDGTLIVTGDLTSLWVSNGLSVGAGGGNGTVQVIGGTLNSAFARRDLVVGSVNAGNYGTFLFGSDSSSGIAYFRNALVSAQTNNLSLIELQSGTVDVSGSLSLGKTKGTANSVKMVLGGTATLNALNLNVGVNAEGTSARLDVNGSGVTVIADTMSLVNDSQINFNFDDSGISTLTATNKLWYEPSLDVNVVGTENVWPGSYVLLVGTTGGSVNETLAFDISGFSANCTTEVIKTIEGEKLTYTLNVVNTEQPDLSAFVSNGIFYVSSTNLSPFGTNYLQATPDLVSGTWITVSSAVGVSSTNWPASPDLASEFFRVLWQ